MLAIPAILCEYRPTWPLHFLLLWVYLSQWQLREGHSNQVLCETDRQYLPTVPGQLQILLVLLGLSAYSPQLRQVRQQRGLLAMRLELRTPKWHLRFATRGPGSRHYKHLPIRVLQQGQQLLPEHQLDATILLHTSPGLHHHPRQRTLQHPPDRSPGRHRRLLHKNPAADSHHLRHRDRHPKWQCAHWGQLHPVLP